MDEPPTRGAMRLRRALYDQLDPVAYANNGRDGLSHTNIAIIFIVIISSVAVILETEPTIVDRVPQFFGYIEYVFTGIFLVEYVARLWAEGEDPRYRTLLGRLRYALTPAAVVDLAAFLPSLVAPGISSPMLLRGFRLIRILRLASLGRFSQAIGHLSEAVVERAEELLLSLLVAMFILIFSAAMMYSLEGQDNPEAFGSIPRALWWSVCTLTTVGYGDIYPHSVLGKICGGLTSMAGIGLIAMPTGILAAAFSDAFQRTRNSREAVGRLGETPQPIDGLVHRRTI